MTTGLRWTKRRTGHGLLKCQHCGGGGRGRVRRGHGKHRWSCMDCHKGFSVAHDI